MLNRLATWGVVLFEFIVIIAAGFLLLIASGLSIVVVAVASKVEMLAQWAARRFVSRDVDSITISAWVLSTLFIAVFLLSSCLYSLYVIFDFFLF